MRFLPLETCKKLVEMGCKSESLFHWYISPIGPEGHTSVVLFQSFQGPTEAPAFCLEDFLGSHPQAWDNCRRLIDGRIDTNSQNFRYDLVDCNLEFDDWVKYIEELVG